MSRIKNFHGTNSNNEEQVECMSMSSNTHAIAVSIMVSNG